MKTVEDMRTGMDTMKDMAGKAAKNLRKGAEKAAYAVVGAPVVARRRAMEYGSKVAEIGRHELEAWIAEGEKLTEELKDRQMVTELRERVDFEQIQGRVEKLRDQLEDVLANWKDNFAPDEATPVAKPAAASSKTAAKKPAAKTAAKKPAAKTAAKKPAAKASTARTTTRKTAATKS